MVCSIINKRTNEKPKRIIFSMQPGVQKNCGSTKSIQSFGIQHLYDVSSRGFRGHDIRACSHVTQTQTHRGIKLGNIILEGSSFITVVP